MRKGVIWAVVVIAAILIYIMVFAGSNSYDPNAMKYGDTASLSNRINLREKYTDTVAMSNRVNLKLAIADTVNKWIPKGTLFPDSVQFFNTAGRVNQRIKIWSDTLSPNTASAYSVNISSAGFTSIISASAVAEQNTGTASSVANIGIKSYSTTVVVLNITQGNSSLINILGSNVLLGPSNQFATTVGLRIHITVIGY